MDNQHPTLRLLGIFHFVFAGVVLLTSLLPMLWILLANAWWPAITEGDTSVSLVLTETLAVIMIAFVLLLTWSLVVALVVAGRKLLAGRGMIYCQVVAAICCLLFPLGTLLGVATLIVTTNEQSRRLG